MAKIVTYAILVNIFLFFCEIFTVFYSQLPDHMLHFKYLFLGWKVRGNWCLTCGFSWWA